MSVSKSWSTVQLLKFCRKCQTPLHGHRLRTCCTTPPTDKLTAILQQICHIAMPVPNISTCQDVGNLGCGKFLSVPGEFVVQQVVELLWARPLVVLYNMFVTGVRLVEFGTKSVPRRWRSDRKGVVDPSTCSMFMVRQSRRYWILLHSTVTVSWVCCYVAAERKSIQVEFWILTHLCSQNDDFCRK